MEKETQETIQRIADYHSNNTFGYLSNEDLKGEIWKICIEAIPEYDEKYGKLENFLRKTVKNRLINKFKDITKSVTLPCKRCPYYTPDDPKTDCAKFEDKRLCSKFNNYTLSVESRNSLLNVSDTIIENKHYNDNTLDKLISKEMISTLRKYLPETVKIDLNKFLTGEKISLSRRTRLIEESKKIMLEKEINDG